MEFKFIKTSEKDGIYNIILNRPPLNWLNIEMMDEINKYLESLKAAKTQKLLVISAEGKAFSVGVEVADHLGDKAERMIETFHKMFRLLDEIKIPSLAVVNGSALGGGCELALYCDMVIASDRAKFGQPEIQVGVFPPIAALIFPRIIGRKKAMELILTGETISAQDALSIGLINKVVPEASLQQEVEGFVDKFKKLSGVVLRIAKEATLSGLNDDIEKGLRTIERIYLNNLMKTCDTVEGLKAFLEKRKPEWKEE